MKPLGAVRCLHAESHLKYGAISSQTLNERLRHALGSRISAKPMAGLLTLGLAVSGGVDSMALAALCARSSDVFKFHAFVVDHGARKGSELEAEAVKREVTKLGIPTSVLKLEWPSAENPSHLLNFETSARTLRYQALGKACLKHDISYLCVAHHLDDQHETLLMRLIQGHGRSGLLGMKSSSDIPECSGLYGVSQSGRWNTTNSDLTLDGSFKAPSRENENSTLPAAQGSNLNSHKGARSSHHRAKDALNRSTSKRVSAVEALPNDRLIFRQRVQPSKYPDCQYFEIGGVKLLRPFLEFNKDSLLQTCKQYSVPWFEDHTNQDQTVTRRNAIRYIINKHTLPRALQKESMISRMSELRAEESLIERRSNAIYHSFHIMSLNLGTGTLAVRLPVTLDNEPLNAEAALRTISRLVQHVSPKSNVSKSNLAIIRGLAWPSDSEPPASAQKEQHIYTFSGVLIRRKRLARWQQSISEIEVEKTKIKALDPHFYWELSRQPFSIQEKQLVTEIPPMSLLPSKVTDNDSPPWHLWDGRYWIRIWHNLPDPLYVRGFRKEDMNDFRQSLDRPHFIRLKARLKKYADGDIRYTLPAIVMNDKDKGGNSRVLALPSLGVFERNMFFERGPITYQVLYKHIDLRSGLASGRILPHLPHAYPEPELESSQEKTKDGRDGRKPKDVR